MELNLKTVDGMLLLSLGACQLAFAALASIPWEVGFGPRDAAPASPWSSSV